MVVILGDGTVVADDDPRARLRRARQQLPDSRLKYALLAVALAAGYSFVNAPASEAAGGIRPAPRCRAAGARRLASAERSR